MIPTQRWSASWGKFKLSFWRKTYQVHRLKVVWSTNTNKPGHKRWTVVDRNVSLGFGNWLMAWMKLTLLLDNIGIECYKVFFQTFQKTSQNLQSLEYALFHAKAAWMPSASSFYGSKSKLKFGSFFSVWNFLPDSYTPFGVCFLFLTIGDWVIDLVDLIVVSAHIRILNIESLVVLGAKVMILVWIF